MVPTSSRPLGPLPPSSMSPPCRRALCPACAPPGWVNPGRSRGGGRTGRQRSSAAASHARCHAVNGCSVVCAFLRASASRRRAGALRAPPAPPAPALHMLPPARLLQVQIGQRWGTICGPVGTAAAQVICGSLGLRGGAPMYRNTKPAPWLPILMSGLKCSGEESTLSMCSFSTSAKGCRHERDAAVRCKREWGEGAARRGAGREPACGCGASDPRERRWRGGEPGRVHVGSSGGRCRRACRNGSAGQWFGVTSPRAEHCTRFRPMPRVAWTNLDTRRPAWPALPPLPCSPCCAICYAHQRNVTISQRRLRVRGQVRGFSVSMLAATAGAA